MLFTLFMAINIVCYFFLPYICKRDYLNIVKLLLKRNIMNQAVQTNSSTKLTKRKSERLGWKSLAERDRRPLSERIGEGRRVYANTKKSPFVLVP